MTHIVSWKENKRHHNFYVKKNSNKRGKTMGPNPHKMFHYMCYQLQSFNFFDNGITRLYLRNQVTTIDGGQWNLWWWSTSLQASSSFMMKMRFYFKDLRRGILVIIVEIIKHSIWWFILISLIVDSFLMICLTFDFSNLDLFGFVSSSCSILV